jgi:hypothetical protein
MELTLGYLIDAVVADPPFDLGAIVDERATPDRA